VPIGFKKSGNCKKKSFFFVTCASLISHRRTEPGSPRGSNYEKAAFEFDLVPGRLKGL